MELIFNVHGHSCDLALHPISEKTARTISEHGSDVYAMKPLEWWRKGNTATWGMRIDDECNIKVTMDGKPVQLDPALITANPLQIRRRLYLDSRARYLCVLGFDNEICNFSWKWSNITSFDPSRFEFMVHQWDRIMGQKDYFILDEIRYDGVFADRHDWCDAAGFSLVTPRVIDLEEVRQELTKGSSEHAGSPFPSAEIETATTSV